MGDVFQMEFNYFIPTRILFGCGQLSHLHEHRLPGKRALIVTTAGGSVKRHGYLARLERELALADVTTVLFDKILSNPVKRHVMEGAALAKTEGCDFVVGLGGGSSIDAAKAIAVMAVNPGDYWDYVSGGTGGGKPVAHDPLPVVAVTTTAGTGTEADPWTVTTKEETNEKIGFGYEKTFPVLSVVDPELMRSVPASFTAYQGFDALFHSTEGTLNIHAYPVSDLYAFQSIELIGKSLADAVADGENLRARSDVALGNTLAGMVESTSGCISEHAIEHALSAYHPKLPHGAGLIMISAAYYTLLAHSGKCDARMVRMAQALGKTDAREATDFVAALVDLQRRCGVDALKMSDYGITPDEFDKFVRNSREAMGKLYAVDPIVLTDADVRAILEQSYR